MSSLTARAAQWQNSCGCMLTFHRAAPATQWAELPNKNFYLNLDYLDNLLGSLKRDGWQVVTVEELTGRLERGENGSRLSISRSTIVTRTPSRMWCRCSGVMAFP